MDSKKFLDRGGSVECGGRVVLTSFQGVISPPESARASENYWKLIGKCGVVAKTEVQAGLARHKNGERVLVVFDVDIAALGLHCHNGIHNSLWFLISDLRRAEQ